jgi:hypothetical protein
MGAFLGRDCSIEILVGKDTRAKVNGVIPKPVSPDDDYVLLGGTKGLEKNGSWDTTDVTNRSSEGNVRETLVTYLSVDGSTDGVYLPETSYNIVATETYFYAPTSGQPYAWIKVTRPGPTAGATVTEEMYVLLTEFSFSAPDDDKASFTMSWVGQQAPIVTAVAAP